MAKITQQDVENFRGAVVITTSQARMVIRTDAGPRIVGFGRPDDSNLLLCDSEDRRRGDWHLLQGHRVWPTRPGADESEDAYRPDNEPCYVSFGEHSVSVVSPTDPVLQIQKGFSITVLSENRFSVNNFVRNTGSMLYSCGVWALTCTLPTLGTSYSIPLGDGSDWDCFTYKIFRAWGGHTSPINDRQIDFSEDMLHIYPTGVETKRMIEAPRGIIAMNTSDCTFAKKTGFSRGAQYPHGCNVAFYIGPDNFMVEMETIGPEVPLKPGESARNEETWILTERRGLDAAELVHLFS